MGTKEQYEARKASAKAERDKQKWWFQQPDPINRFTGWLVAWTALLFFGTIISAGVLLKTDHTLQDTIAANREVSSNQLTAFDREAKIRLRSYIAIIPGRVLFEPNK